MKVKDIMTDSESINNIVNYVLKQPVIPREGYQTEIDGKIHVTGSEIKETYDYDFILDGLEITIDYSIQAMPDQKYKVDEFWGNQIRIDIAAQNEDGTRLSKAQLRNILKQALGDYLELYRQERHHYHQL